MGGGDGGAQDEELWDGRAQLRSCGNRGAQLRSRRSDGEHVGGVMGGMLSRGAVGGVIGGMEVGELSWGAVGGVTKGM